MTGRAGATQSARVTWVALLLVLSASPASVSLEADSVCAPRGVLRRELSRTPLAFVEAGGELRVRLTPRAGGHELQVRSGETVVLQRTLKDGTCDEAGLATALILERYVREVVTPLPSVERATAGRAEPATDAGTEATEDARGVGPGEKQAGAAPPGGGQKRGEKAQPSSASRTAAGPGGAQAGTASGGARTGAASRGAGASSGAASPATPSSGAASSGTASSGTASPGAASSGPASSGSAPSGASSSGTASPGSASSGAASSGRASSGAASGTASSGSASSGAASSSTTNSGAAAEPAASALATPGASSRREVRLEKPVVTHGEPSPPAPPVRLTRWEVLAGAGGWAPSPSTLSLALSVDAALVLQQRWRLGLGAVFSFGGAVPVSDENGVPRGSLVARALLLAPSAAWCSATRLRACGGLFAGLRLGNGGASGDLLFQSRSTWVATPSFGPAAQLAFGASRFTAALDVSLAVNPVPASFTVEGLSARIDTPVVEVLARLSLGYGVDR